MDLNHYVRGSDIKNEPIEFSSGDIDYLETSIKCVELYQWLSRHFDGKYFAYDEYELLENKGKAIERLNELLSDKIVRTCASCGVPLEETSRFAICEECFSQKRFRRGGRNYSRDRKDNKKTEKRSNYKSSKKRSFSSNKKNKAQSLTKNRGPKRNK